MLAALALTLALTAPPLIITDVNSGQTVKLAVGRPLEVRLPANPTTGYQWSAAAPAGALTVTGPPVYQRPTSGLMGADGTEVFAYRAVAPGTARLSFTYARSFEHVAPAKHVTVTIVVISR